MSEDNNSANIGLIITQEDVIHDAIYGLVKNELSKLIVRETLFGGLADEEVVGLVVDVDDETWHQVIDLPDRNDAEQADDQEEDREKEGYRLHISVVEKSALNPLDTVAPGITTAISRLKLAVGVFPVIILAEGALSLYKIIPSEDVYSEDE